MAVAYLIVKRRSKLTAMLDVLVMLPLTIAGTVLILAIFLPLAAARWLFRVRLDAIE